LGLASNRIRKKGAISIAEALKNKNSSVTGLDLGNNEIGNGGAHALAEGLKYNTVLTSLDLRSCEIHIKGIFSLSDMGNYNTSLRHLDLGANYAKNQGAIAFAKVLSNNSSLTRLCLTDNQIYHEGGEALAKALQTNYTLRNFSYGGQGPSANRIDSSIRRVIDSIISENKKNWEVKQNENGIFESTSIGSSSTRSSNFLSPRFKSTSNNEKYKYNNNRRPSYSNTSYTSDSSSNIFSNYNNNSNSNYNNTNSNYNNTNKKTLNKNDTTNLPTWFMEINEEKKMFNDKELESKLKIIFVKKLLTAENPKFPGSYFIGNILNTLKKIFPDTKIDELQLILFAYNNNNYYVHLSREIAKTQLKYIGKDYDDIEEEEEEEIEVIEKKNENTKKSNYETTGLEKGDPLGNFDFKDFSFSKKSNYSQEEYEKDIKSIVDNNDIEIISPVKKDNENILLDENGFSHVVKNKKQKKKNIFGVIGESYLDKKVNTNEDEIDFSKLEEQMNSLKF
jgi:hypothetical protein